MPTNKIFKISLTPLQKYVIVITNHARRAETASNKTNAVPNMHVACVPSRVGALSSSLPSSSKRKQTKRTATVTTKALEVPEDASIAGLTVWQAPTEGSNALANVFGSTSPIEGLGSITGYWFLDVFAGMNAVLVFALLVGTTLKDMREED